MRFSVIIPTHNRGSSLVRTVDSAMALDYPPEDFEVLVVDNASTDDTATLVRDLQAQYPKPALHYVREDRLGLHHARHAGARHASGEVLLFTDDDATFHPDWLQGYAGAFDAHPEMVAAGGPVRPVWECDLPQWFLDYMGDYGPGFEILSIWEPWEELQLEPGGPFFYGVNMAIYREVLFRVGGFNPEAYGEVWVGDGESGLNRKLGQHGLTVGYVPQAMVYHHIPAGRVTVAYFCRRMANEGACQMYAQYHPDLPSRLRLCRRLAGLVLRNAGQWLRARRRKGRTDLESLQLQMDAARTRAQFKYVARLLYSKEFRQLVLKKDWLGPA